MPGKLKVRKRSGGAPSGQDKAAKRFKKSAKPASAEPIAEGVSDESDLDLSEDDVNFVDDYAGRLGFLKNAQVKPQDSTLSKNKLVKDPPPVKAPVLEEGVEQYEEAPRRRLAEEKQEKKTGTAMLPIKMPDGQLVYGNRLEPAPLPKVHADGITVHEIDDIHRMSARPAKAKKVSAAQKPSSNDNDEAAEAEREAVVVPEIVLPEPPGMGTAQVTHAERENIREQIALSATKLLHAPDPHGASLRYLVGLCASNDDKVSRLAMLSLAAVFKDVLPGYRIRPPTDKEKGMSVSKDVRRTRDQEALLLSSYQAYLKQLLKAANSKRAGADALVHARVGVRCLCSLLASLHHFNYASDILQAVVPRMAHHDQGIASECQNAVRVLLITDADGKMAREAVQLVADLVKVRKCLCKPAVVRVLLSLELAEAEAPKTGGVTKAAKLSHKARKRRKRDRPDDVSAAFKQADAKADAAERADTQSKTLEALLEIFFRVLKQCTASGLLRGGTTMSSTKADAKFPLLLPSLEGLAKFGHNVDVEYFGDMLAVMQTLLESKVLPLPERLSTLLTASSLLMGQGEALTIDRRGLFEALFYALSLESLSSLQDASPASETSTADQEPDAADTLTQNKVNETTTLLIQTTMQMLLEQGRALDMTRLAAFAKRLALAAVCVRVAPAMGLLAILDRLLRRNTRLRATLEMEPNASGPPRPQPHTQEARSNLDAAAAVARSEGLWEVAVLRHHYHPHVAAAAKSILANLAEGSAVTPSSVLASPGGPSAIAGSYMQASAHAQSSQHSVSKQASKSRSKTAQGSAVIEEARRLLQVLYVAETTDGVGTRPKAGATAAYVRLCELSVC